ncbi:MAG: InlB B-repeat-containing protein, partial [Burkholderiales bacterium]
NWEAIVYNITYVMNGGTNHPDNPTTYTVEKLPITLKDPTRDGYTFDGWTPTNTIPNGSTGDKTFTANWKAIEYKITYVLNGGTNHAENPDKYTVETPTITLKDPTRNGYTFEGWTPTNTIPSGSKGDKTFTANWKAIEYKITYVLNGGANHPDNPDKYTVETPTITLKDPARDGYTFQGWSPTDTIPQGSTGDKTFTANWKATVYNINYVMNGGTNHPDNPKTYTVEQLPITLKDPTRAGYTFKGWSPAGNIPAGSTGDKTFTADWEKIEYKITYVLNGGTNHPDNPTTYTVESPTITLKDPTRTGYRFTGWSPTDSIPEGSTGDKTFTANWEAIEYNITYIMNGGTNHAENPSKYTVEKLPITLKNPSYTGHTFKGWTPNDTIPVGSTGDKTFTANWDVNIYNITTSATNGTITPSRTVSYGDSATIEYKANTGYHLESIAIDGVPLADISGYENSYTFTNVDDDHTISVVFAANTYTITTAVINGTISTSQSAVAGGNVNVTYSANSGYHLESITVDGAALSDLVTYQSSYKFEKITADHSILVVYAPNSYMVTTSVTNGVITPSTTTTYGKDVTIEFSPNPGFRLTGITVDDAPLAGFPANQSSYTFRDIASSHTIAVTYEKNVFIVTFVDYDGTVLGTDAVEYGMAATAPANPSRAGYTFTGWDKDFSRVISDMTVTATYSGPLTYTVRFFRADGVTQIGATQTVTWGSAARMETAPAVANSTFSGWRLIGDNPDVPTRLNNVRENIDAIATYNAVLIPVTFVDYDGTELGRDSVPYGGDATPPEDPTREGHTFTGWAPSYNNVTEALTVTAQYRINTYVVTFVDYDGAVIKRQTVEWNTGADAPEDPTREGYVFTGWDVPFNRIVRDTTVTAQYSPGPAPSPTTIVEEPIPQTGGGPLDWMWWLLLIPLLALLLLLISKWFAIIPIAEAVSDNGNGTYTVQWGYENRKLGKRRVDRDKSYITVFKGTLLGSSSNPPVEFERGRVENVFTTIVDKYAEIQWKIKRRKAKVDITELDKHN